MSQSFLKTYLILGITLSKEKNHESTVFSKGISNEFHQTWEYFETINPGWLGVFLLHDFGLRTKEQAIRSLFGNAVGTDYPRFY